MLFIRPKRRHLTYKTDVKFVVPVCDYAESLQ